MNRYNYIKSIASSIIALSFLIISNQAKAATITVTGTGDTIAVDGFVTLREAITAANTDAISGDAPAGSGNDTINFNIAGAPGTVHTIQPTSGLPNITDVVTIDGYSQPGASVNSLAVGNNAFLVIELDGTNAGLNAGLFLSAGNSVIQGLVINRFANEGIVVVIGGSNTIRGNFLGTDQTGQLDRGNGVSGLALLSSNNLVGGILPSDRNLVSGNDTVGISVLNDSTSNRILNNYIGTNDSGLSALANTGAGISVTAINTSIGGILAGTGNIIAFNSGVGVLLTSTAGAGNLILGNSIHSNGDLGIDLNNDGATGNDALDVDVGPNNLQNFPVLSTAKTNESGLVVKGTLESTPSTSHRVEFFANTTADPSGSGEGETYLGFIDVITDVLGNASFTFSSSTGQPVDAQISATATDPNNNTSEFALDIPVVFFPNSSRDDDDDNIDIFADDDFGPIPFGFGPPPFPPAPFPPEVANGVVPPEVSLGSEDINVEESSPISVSGPVSEGARVRSEKKSDSDYSSDANQEVAGCSTRGKMNPSLGAFAVIVLAWLKFRRKRAAQA